MGLVSELKRRNVFRMAALYVAAAWVVMEVAGALIDLGSLPEWVGPIILPLLAIGLPIALVLSWFYELTPEGVSLERDVKPGESIMHVTGRRLDFIIIAVLCAGLIVFSYDKWWVGPPPEKSVAVLAFENMSGDPEQEYFSDGMSETLIHMLTQVSGLKVTAKTSSFYFKDKDFDIGEIAHQLNVSTILEGSVQKAGTRVRVIAQLIDAEDGTHLWSQSFERDLEDIFAVQDEIAEEVVKSLKVTLLDAEEQRLAQRYRPKLEAYDQLIVGRHEMAKRTADSLAAAEQHFKRAIELDPDYALPYVDLAFTYNLQVRYGGLVFEKSLQSQQALVDKALALDPFSGEAYAMSANLHGSQQLKTGEVDVGALEEEVLRAIELNPNFPSARHEYSMQLMDQGRYDEALAQIRVAAELDPMSPIIQLNVIRTLWVMGRVEDSLSLLRRNIERTPEFPNNYGAMARSQTQLGHLGEAQRWIQEARRRNPGDAYTWWYECLGFLNLGDVLSAEDCFKQLGEAHPDKAIYRGGRRMLHSYRGEWKTAIAILEYATERIPGFRPTQRQLADWIAGQGDVERALQLMTDAYPELLDDRLELEGTDLNAAVIFAAVLNANGDTQRRNILLRAAEEPIATMHRLHGDGYGVLDVYIYTMLGDRDRAIAALREAIDVGWRISCCYPGDGSWWMLRQDWKLADLHQDPEFIALVNELEEDVRAQRQWYEDHKDDPLF